MHAVVTYYDWPKQILMNETIFYAFIIIWFFVSIAISTNKLLVNFNFFDFYALAFLFLFWFHSFRQHTLNANVKLVAFRYKRVCSRYVSVGDNYANRARCNKSTITSFQMCQTSMKSINEWTLKFVQIDARPMYVCTYIHTYINTTYKYFFF